jgi:hypothetical protein
MANYQPRSLDSENSPYLSLEIFCNERNRRRAEDDRIAKRVTMVAQFILILFTLPIVLVGFLLRREIPLGVLIAGGIVLALVWLIDIAVIRLNARPHSEDKPEDYRMLKLPLDEIRYEVPNPNRTKGQDGWHDEFIFVGFSPYHASKAELARAAEGDLYYVIVSASHPKCMIAIYRADSYGWLES